jgi:putative peptide zinc metalloprotease protein
MVQLFRLQERPRRGAGVLVTERPTPDGDVITILKNPRHMTYYRLSRRGRFIWERLDGFHDMRSLTIEFFREFRQIAPDVIAATVEGLARTRMIDAGRLSDELGKPIVRPSRGDRILMGARRALSAELALRNLDGRVTAAYNRGVRLLFTRPAQFLLAVIAVGGLAAFIAGAASAQRVLGGPHKELIAVILGGASVSLFLHEAAHAFTVKHFGRELHRGGIGWYWFAPVAFVDTSDMWLGTRRERILVSAAGPYADMLVAGLLATAGLLITDPFASTLLWSLALPSYMAVLLNLNPLLEFDGYHVLSDLLDRPNLRSDSLGWLGANFPAVLRDRDARARHRVEFTYSIASLLYIVVSAVVLVVVYRLTVRGLVASVVPADVASALAWVLAAMVTVLAALGSLAELRAGRNARSAGRF